MSCWVFVIRYESMDVHFESAASDSLISASTYGLGAAGSGGYIAVFIVSAFVYFTIVLSLAEMSSM